MRPSPVLLVALIALAAPAAAQSTTHVAGGDVSFTRRARVDRDSARRVALTDFGARGRVTSVDLDSADARVFWDVTIVPAHTRRIVRYRVDAVGGGILDIREFGGTRGVRGVRGVRGMRTRKP